MTVDNQICAPFDTLSEVLDKYLAMRGIEKKKYYSKYMIIAGEVWSDIFRKTLFATKSVWKTIQSGNPYNYIEKPRDCSILLSVSVDDGCGEMRPIYYNPRLNTVAKPTNKSCGCTSCDCELCEDVDNLVMTTKEAFTINNVTYYEKKWLKYCKNGDIIEYREIPTKKYNDFAGDSGDYNNDWMNDYDISNTGLSNFTITTHVDQRVICKLETRPCGCPDNTEANQKLLVETCGCNLNISCCTPVTCDRFLGFINDNCLGEVKLSECGNKIFFRPNRKQFQNKTIPEFLQVNYQTNGRVVDAETQVPDKANIAMYAGIDYFSKRFHSSYSLSEKTEAKAMFEHEKNQLFLLNNRMTLEDLSRIQDAKIKW